MQNEDVIDWGDDIDESADVISLTGYEGEDNTNTTEIAGESAKATTSKSTATDINLIAFDGPRLDNKWILRISSVGEPYFYNSIDKMSVWRCPGFTQPATESAEKKRKLQSQQSLQRDESVASQKAPLEDKRTQQQEAQKVQKVQQPPPQRPQPQTRPQPVQAQKQPKQTYQVATDKDQHEQRSEAGQRYYSNRSSNPNSRRLPEKPQTYGEKLSNRISNNRAQDKQPGYYNRGYAPDNRRYQQRRADEGSGGYYHQQQHQTAQTPAHPQQHAPQYAYFPLNTIDPYSFTPPEPTNYFQSSPSPTTTAFGDFTRFLPPPAANLIPSSPTSTMHTIYPLMNSPNRATLQHKHTPPPQPVHHHYQPPQTRMRSMKSNQHLASEFKSTNRSAVLEDFRVNGKHTKPELHNIFGYVTEFATDQLGSRFIQQKLDNAPPESLMRVFEEIFPNTVELSSDVFGNYVIQKLFEHGTQDQRLRLVNKIKDCVPTLSFQMYGCRVVQKAIECVEEAEQLELVKRVETITERAVQDQNANHVIQRIIERVDPDKLGNFPEVFANNAKELATHPYGCRVLQRSFEHIGQARSRELIEQLHESVDNLVVDMFGNYVVQYLLEFGTDEDRSRIVVKINQRFFELARHKFASNVCEKALIKANEKDKEMLIYRLIDRSDEASVDGIPSLMKDQFGNYVLQRAINAHVAALHFENSISPGSTIKLRPGKVWFTFEVKVDTGKKSQYSATKSAITIGIISVVLSYGAPAAVAASAGGAAAAGTAASSSASAGAAKFFTSQGANIAKLSTYLIGKSAKKVSEEYGGMSAVQEEVLSVVKSPNVDKVTRMKALESLSKLKQAYKDDMKAKGKTKEAEDIDNVSIASKPPSYEDTVKEKKVARVHGLYVKERLELEVRVANGVLEVRDKANDKVL
ncbi:ARM repeat-containing protein [Wallemia mellicola]|nr:ARM repeat-containing protein [Wallemia mellicola]